MMLEVKKLEMCAYREVESDCQSGRSSSSVHQVRQAPPSDTHIECSQYEHVSPASVRHLTSRTFSVLSTTLPHVPLLGLYSVRKA